MHIPTKPCLSPWSSTAMDTGHRRWPVSSVRQRPPGGSGAALVLGSSITRAQVRRRKRQDPLKLEIKRRRLSPSAKLPPKNISDRSQRWGQKINPWLPFEVEIVILMFRWNMCGLLVTPLNCIVLACVQLLLLCVSPCMLRTKFKVIPASLVL